MSFQHKFRLNRKTLCTPLRLSVLLANIFVFLLFFIWIHLYNRSVKNKVIRELQAEVGHVEQHKKAFNERRGNSIDQVKLPKHVALLSALPQKQSVVDVAFTNLTVYFEKGCKGASYTISSHDHSQYSTCQNYGGQPMRDQMRSVRVSGSGDVDIFERCDDASDSYWASVMEVDGCTNVYDWPPWGTLHFVPRTLNRRTTEAREMVKHDDRTPAKYVVAYSVESSKYFGYQVYASLHGFQVSGQDGATYVRLLTCQKEDDLAQVVPTWTAKRHPYSRRYGPLNKPDVTMKWLASPYAPKEEVIVMIDPDNWLTRNIRPIVDRVKRGHGIAQVAFYAGSSELVHEMYKRFCDDPSKDGHCDGPLAMSSVPYLLHREDFKVIAPLWKKYTLAIKEGIEADRSIADRFDEVQVGWCAEMFAFNMACAHAGVTVDLENDLQMRDVSTVSKDRATHVPMIHMGRAWLPRGHELAKPYLHTEGQEFAYLGDQVWCKCNDTAADILPWPIPDNLDYVSDITLRYLHDAKEKFGYVGESEYRPSGYLTALP